MKRCPYCAEEIQDAAIVCRYCGRALAPGAPSAAPRGPLPPGGAPSETPGDAPPSPDAPAPDDEPLQYTHSGRRFLLGYGRDFFGIWDREAPTTPVARYPRTDEGWRAAWIAFAADEPQHAEVGLASPGVAAVAGAPALGRAAVSPGSRGVNGAWWLLPIFMGWLGGLIAWLVNKDVDQNKARAMLLTGIAISVAIFLVFIAAADSPAGTG